MAQVKEHGNEELWLTSAISTKLLGDSAIVDYNVALKALRESAQKAAPGGRLVTFLSNGSDKFRPIDKLASNIALSKTIYNERALTTNPEIGLELSELLVHVNAINKIIDKRREKTKKPFKQVKKEVK
jgi:hypothetical protein